MVSHSPTHGAATANYLQTPSGPTMDLRAGAMVWVYYEALPGHAWRTGWYHCRVLAVVGTATRRRAGSRGAMKVRRLCRHLVRLSCDGAEFYDELDAGLLLPCKRTPGPGRAPRRMSWVPSYRARERKQPAPLRL